MPKLKVLHLFSDYLPNTQNWIANILSNCKEVEHHIGAYRFLHNNYNSNNFKYAYDAVDKNREALVASNKKGISRWIELIKIKVDHLLNGTTQNKLISYCSDHNITILHAHFANTAWQFLSLKHATGLPFVVSFYGWDYEKLSFLYPQYESHLKVLFDVSDAIICEGEHGAKILISKGCKEEKIQIIPLGVNPKNVHFKKRTKIKNELRLVQIATFTEKKGQDITIKAFSRALEKCPNLLLTLIGKDQGTLNINLELIKSLQLDDKITIIEEIPYSLLHKTLSEFDVFIHPSKYAQDKDCEGGAPIVILDAAATGMPVLSSKHCDIPSEVIHGKTGFLVKEGDYDDLALRIEEFYIMNNENFQYFSLNARRHIEDDFDIRILAKKLEKLYRNL